MTPTAHDQLTLLAEQRRELNAEGQRIAKAYCLAVLDHVTAKIRTACPEAVFVTFAFYSTRALDLHGVLGAQTSPWGRAPNCGTTAKAPRSIRSTTSRTRSSPTYRPRSRPTSLRHGRLSTATRPPTGTRGCWNCPRSTGSRVWPSWCVSATRKRPPSSSTAASRGPDHRGPRRPRRRRYADSCAASEVDAVLRHQPHPDPRPGTRPPRAGQPTPDAPAQRLRPPARRQHQRSDVPDAAAADRLAHGRWSR